VLFDKFVYEIIPGGLNNKHLSEFHRTLEVTVVAIREQRYIARKPLWTIIVLFTLLTCVQIDDDTAQHLGAPCVHDSYHRPVII
jgi:hypothetical protein